MRDYFLPFSLTRFRELRHTLMKVGEAVDDRTLLEALEGLIELRDAIVATVRSALGDGYIVSRLRARKDMMEAQFRGLDRWSQGGREMAQTAMGEAGIPHIAVPGVRINVYHSPPALVVNNEGPLPRSYGIAASACLDCPATREATRGGAEVPGAELLQQSATYHHGRTDLRSPAAAPRQSIPTPSFDNVQPTHKERE